MFALSILSPGLVIGQADDSFGQERRPFDFNDEHYSKNGVNPRMIANRRTGFDKYSVVDFIDSEIHRNVRITGTWPVDDSEGNLFFAAPLGEISIKGFTRDRAGRRAFDVAHRYPYFVFPSTKTENNVRQAAVVEFDEEYFKKNPLGISVMIDVEFTRKAYTKEGRAKLRDFIGHNGLTLDGTFAIRKVSEIDKLTWLGFVTQKLQNADNPDANAFTVMTILKEPRYGAISPDANLVMVLDRNQHPLTSEMVFLREFDCLKTAGSWCRR